MKRRTEQQWQSLLEQQRQSNVSIKVFCDQHNISQSSFYKGKKAQKTSSQVEIKSNFIKAKPQSPPRAHNESIEMQHRDVVISVPSSIHPIWLADFVKAIA